MIFRDLTANEIDARIGTVNKKGLTLLLYKDARCDMAILDETVGAERWQREHYEVKGNLYCRVGIKFETTSDWVWKSDCGTESYTEKQKGESSDSFKRACVNWGIGRELYTAPLIYIPAANNDGTPNYEAFEKNGKMTTNDKFEVTKMTVENKRIAELVIINTKSKKCVFSYPDKPVSNSASEPTKPQRTDPRNNMIVEVDKLVSEFAQMRGKTKAEVMSSLYVSQNVYVNPGTDLSDFTLDQLQKAGSVLTKWIRKANES